MKKILSALLVMAMVFSLAACAPAGGTPSETPKDQPSASQTPSSSQTPAPTETTSGEPKSVGFVTFGLGGDFFQALADTFVKNFTAAGWEAQYADGQFNPTAQMEAAENFIAMGVDVLVIWSVAPEAMNTVIADAQAKGIKVVAFVAETENYDALMVSDDAELADYCAKLAARWIDETYPDAADGSVPVAVFSCRTAETGVVQADELLKIEEFSTKAKLVKEVECADENMTTGQSNMENLYASNPEIKVFLTAHNGLAMGINSYFTAVSSPVTDYTGMGIFAINGDATSGEIIKSAAEGESPFRGMVLTGSVNDTANEMLYVCNGLMDGSIASGHLQKAGTLFVYEETVEEYLSTGTVASVTGADFD